MIRCVVLFLAAAMPAAAQMSFVEQIVQTGADDESFGRGSAMIDLDQDGLLDLVTGNKFQANLVFRQNPDHTFTQVNDLWNIPLRTDLTWGVMVADLDNDGDPDILFNNGTAGGFKYTDNSRLYRNDLATTGAFTDVTDASGDLAIASENFGATVLDYDNDGLLDLFFARKNPGAPSRLLRNNGDLSFSDVGEAAGIVHEASYRHCSTGDFNNDGWMDIAVGALDAPNRLYRNNADGTFTDVAPAAGVDSPNLNFGMVLEDFDNDGWQDIYIPKWQIQPGGPSELYLNNRDGTFRNVTEGSGMTGQTDMGHMTGDVDLDGYPDIFIGTGAPAFASPDKLFLVAPDGSGGLTASDVTATSGIENLAGDTRCHGIVFGDYDRDGDIDIYLNNGGPARSPRTIQANNFLRNEGNGNNWAALKLVGTRSNRDGIGARMAAVTNTGRVVHRIRRATHGFCNTNPAEVWFGIEKDAAIESVQIRWPSGRTQLISNPAMGVITTIVEPDCPADINDDGSASPADFTAWLSCFADATPPICDRADVNGSGAIDPADFTAWLAAFAAGCE